jgi:hypothetical protein
VIEDAGVVLEQLLFQRGQLGERDPLRFLGVVLTVNGRYGGRAQVEVE